MFSRSYIHHWKIDFSQYEITDSLGKGGFGKVYLARKKDNKSCYALKVIRKESQTENIEREIQIMKYLNHPTIIKILGYSNEDFKNQKSISILMEYAKNGSLDKVLQNAPKEFNNTIRQIILIGIALAMKYIHNRNIIHRDLKPQNVLLDDNYHPILSDFGLSKIFHFDNSMEQSIFQMTFLYMAPEIIKGEDYNTKVDVYSFGILMYEVLTGKQPYFNINFGLYDLISKITNDNYRPEFTVPVKKSFKDLIEKCWSKDPNERPTFDEIYAKLINIDSGDFVLENIDIMKIKNYIKSLEDFNDPSEELVRKIANLESNNTKLVSMNSKFTKNNEKLTQEKKEITKKLPRLQKEYLKLKKDNDNLTTKNSELKKDNNNLTTKNSELKKDKDNLSTENNKLKKDNDNLTTENNELKKDKDNLTTENNELKKYNDNLTTANNKLKKDNDNLTTENKKLKKYNDNLSNKNNELKKDNDNLTTKNNELTNYNAKLNKDNKDLAVAIEQKKTKNEEVESKNNELTNENESLKTINKQIKDENQKIVLANQKLMQGIKTLKNDKSIIQNANKEHLINIEDLKKDNFHLSSEIANLKQNVMKITKAAQNQTNNIIMRNNAIIQKLKETNTALADDNQRIADENKKLIEDKDTLINENNVLKNNINILMNSLLSNDFRI